MARTPHKYTYLHIVLLYPLYTEPDRSIPSKQPLSPLISSKEKQKNEKQTNEHDTDSATIATTEAVLSYQPTICPNIVIPTIDTSQPTAILHIIYIHVYIYTYIQYIRDCTTNSMFAVNHKSPPKPLHTYVLQDGHHHAPTSRHPTHLSSRSELLVMIEVHTVHTYVLRYNTRRQSSAIDTVSGTDQQTRPYY